MIAAIYARKSTEQNGVAEGEKSITRQMEHARAYVGSKGWTVDEDSVFVDDGISGAEFTNRPGFLRLMNALKPRPPFQVLIMSEESRLGRESIETAYALKQLVQAGVRVFFYFEDRERTLDSPTDKIMLSLTAFADELEREKARQRTYDAMLRKAKAGHVTGGRVFGYDNVEILGADGKRSHVERRTKETEAAVVRSIFERCAAGQGTRAIAKALNSEGAPAPRAQRGRPGGWSPSSVWEVIHRPLYRGEIVWNLTRKRDRWGRKNQKARAAEDAIRLNAPQLRIVPEELWERAHHRLAGAREDYIRRTGGRAWGRPVNGTESRYLLTGLAQCGSCGGGLFVNSRKHGATRGFVYGCSSYHLRGRQVCENRLLLPLPLVESEVLTAFREDLLDPLVIERALSKLHDRLRESPQSTGKRQAAIDVDLRRVDAELSRLTAALAGGAELTSVVGAIREREARRQVLASELATLRQDEAGVLTDLKGIMPEVRRRLTDWQGLLGQETTKARKMLRALLEGRIVFTPNVEERSCLFQASGNYEELFRGLITLPKAMASPTGFEPVFWP